MQSLSSGCLAFAFFWLLGALSDPFFLLDFSLVVLSYLPRAQSCPYVPMIRMCNQPRKQKRYSNLAGDWEGLAESILMMTFIEISSIWTWVSGFGKLNKL